MKPTLALLTALLLSGSFFPAQAAVTGRYVRIDTLVPYSEIAEIEVYAQGTNILRGHPEFVVGGTDRDAHGPVDPSKAARQLTDGFPGICSLAVPVSEYGSDNVHVEIDLGRDGPLDAVAFQVPRYDNPGHRNYWLGDEGWRVVSVLDAQRRIVFSRLVTLYTPAYMAAKGYMRVELDSPGGPFTGRAVAPKSRAWFSPAEFMTGFLTVKEEVLPADPDRAARVAEFTHRNDAGQIAVFAREFFSGLDLSRPGLEAVRAQVEAGRFAEALELYKRRLITKFACLDCISIYKFQPDPCSGAVMRAQDQLDCRKVDRKARKVTLCRPGDVLDFKLMPWGSDGREAHPRGLLLVYAATGDPKYLARWAEMMDEWAIFFQRWADAGTGRRGYSLPHVYSLAFLTMCKDLREAAKVRPQLVDELPAATLARVFKLIAEENAPAYWRLARKTVFNHQFNAFGGAYFDSRVLEDFHIGTRLQLEMEQHFQRLWTLGMCRDGSMIEAADEGHMAMPQGTAAYVYLQMKEDKPAWFTPDLERWFLHYYRNTSLYQVRHIPPNGLEHRMGRDGDYFSRLNAFLLCEPWGGNQYCADFATKPWPERVGGVPSLADPEVRAIIEAVYGRGHQRAELTPSRQAAYDLVSLKFPGGYQGPPQTVSDYMPYVGIHYLRRGWAPDDSFIEMFCQPDPGSANTATMDELGSIHWDTQFHYWDFAEPLLQSRPLLIDGQNQCRSFVNKTWSPGSKTDRLTEAPEKPLPNRFHCSPGFDYQECFYSGAYQNWELDPSFSPGRGRSRSSQALKISGPAITGVHTTRQIFQLRKERLFVVADRVRFADAQSHQITTHYLMLPKVKDAVVEPDSGHGIIRLVKPLGAQLTVRQFGLPGLKYEMQKPVAERKYLRATWPAQGETVLVSLLEPRRDAGIPETLTTVVSLADPANVGFTATTRDGERIVFSVPVRLSKSAVVPTPEQAVLAVKSGNAWMGLAIGTNAVELEGRKIVLGTNDAEFAISEPGAQPTFTPIYRPIDPPTMLPAQSVFVDKLAVSIVSQTPGVTIRYTTDGSEPDVNSPLYQGPFEITKSCMVQARAFRPGVKAIPFTIEGTRVSDISFARFAKQPLKPVIKPSGELQSGLAYNYIEGEWHRLFAAADRLPAKSSGVTQKLLDVGMRQTDSTFAVRYQGCITVPADGVYTFHAPPEYVHCATPEPGYDLRVIVDGEEWRPGMMWHGLGDWSVALAKGPHRFMVTFADAREKDIEQQRIDYWAAYPSPWVVWRGTVPELLVSGPGIDKQPIPVEWLKHEVAETTEKTK